MMLGFVEGRAMVVELKVEEEKVNVMAEEVKTDEKKHDDGTN